MKRFYLLLSLTHLALCLLPLSVTAMGNLTEEVTIKVTFQVDMRFEEVHPQGVFFSCNILNGYAQTKMEKAYANVWAITIDAPISYEVVWKFLNGPNNYEPNDNLTEECAISGGFSGLVRTHITGSFDEVVPPFCYGHCTDCSPFVNDEERLPVQAISLSPNPASEMVLLKYDFGKTQTTTLRLFGPMGNLVRSVDLGKVSAGEYYLDVAGLSRGVYWLECRSGETVFFKRLVIDS